MRSTLLAATLLSASLALGGCTMLDGYAGVSSGYGYDDGYYDPYYDASYYGWYEDYYYPGIGYYVYDRGGSKHRWSDKQRGYWEGRRGKHQARENWSRYRGDRADRGDGQRWEGRGDGTPGDGRRDWRRDRRGDAGAGTGTGTGTTAGGQERRWGGRGDGVRNNAGRPAPTARPNRGQSGQVRAAPRPAAEPRQPAPSRVERQQSAAPVRQQVQRAEPTNTNVRDE